MNDVLPTQTRVKVLAKFVKDGVQYDPTESAVVLIEWVPELLQQKLIAKIQLVTILPAEEGFLIHHSTELG